MRPDRTTLLAVLRVLLVAVAAAGAVLLLLAQSADVITIKVLTTSQVAGQDTHLSGADRHGAALVVVAVFALVVLVGAARGNRPAMAALAVTGLVALGIAALKDGPDIHKTGKVGELYEDASAKAGTGFYEETLGGALLLLSGGALLLLGWTGRAERTDRRRDADRPAPAEADRDDDWFAAAAE